MDKAPYLAAPRHGLGVAGTVAMTARISVALLAGAGLRDIRVLEVAIGMPARLIAARR